MGNKVKLKKYFKEMLKRDREAVVTALAASDKSDARAHSKSSMLISLFGALLSLLALIVAIVAVMRRS